MSCEHHNFRANVAVNRLCDEGKPITFMADVTIACADCGRQFQFLGLEAGLDTRGARASPDALEARMAICPQGEVPSVLDRIAVHMPPPGRKH